MGGFSQTLKFKPVTLDFDAREPGTIKATNFAKEKSASTLQPLFSAKKTSPGLPFRIFIIRSGVANNRNAKKVVTRRWLCFALLATTLAGLLSS